MIVRSSLVAGLLCLSLVTNGCARITSQSFVSEYPRPGSVESRVFGPGEVLHDELLRGRWIQLGEQLVVEMWQRRICRQLVHLPIVRERKIVRRGGMSLVAEWAIAGGLGAFSIFAFAKPESMGARKFDPISGSEVVDPSSAYRIGSLFAALSGTLLFGSIYDTIRARDEVIYTDAYRLKIEGEIPCRQPTAPLADHPVYLVVGDYRYAATTDENGRVRLRLPAVTGDKKMGVRLAAVVVDERRALEVSYRLPYDMPGGVEETVAHQGRTRGEFDELDASGISTHSGRSLGVLDGPSELDKHEPTSEVPGAAKATGQGVGQGVGPETPK